jgi:hypothetical protein
MIIKMTFTTSFDNIVKRKTVGVCILFAFFSIYFLLLNRGWYWYLPLIAIYTWIILRSYLIRPKRYEIDDNSIIIDRLLGKVIIKFQEIERVDRIHHDLLLNSTSGGPFGYCGKFDTDLGKIAFYATRRNKLIMLTKKDKTKIILTPDQEDEFIKDLEKGINAQH